MPSTCNPDRPNSHFEELCVLAAIGEVIPAEFEELRSHLAECASCRALYTDFCRIASADLGFGAARLIQEGADDRVIRQLDGDNLLLRLRERAKVRPQVAASVKASPRYVRLSSLFHRFSSSIRWNQPVLLRAAFAGLLIVATLSGLFWARGRQLLATLDDLRQQNDRSQMQMQIAAKERQASAQILERSQAAEESLKQKIAAMQSGTLQLREQIRALQIQLDQEEQKSALLNQQLAQSESARTSVLAQRDRQLDQLQSQLADAIQQAQRSKRVETELQAKLRVAEKDLANQSATVDMSESDARELLGARDLHIVDVYDVGASGLIRRAYGRVYYIEKKYFLFYAFNLGKETPGQRKMVAFQAWGFREADKSKAESLGLFYVDDAKANRWALKVTNPAVLEHIDTVSVTVEPPGGSPFPRGHRLLYASLTGPPNHP